jgi:hypothetical protein
MITPMTLLVLLLLLLVWLFIRRRQPRQSKAPRTSVRTKNATTEYHAVSIKFSNNACEPAQQLEGRRFLSSAAPRLPLPECDVLECNCRFVHHKDRRIGKDRRSPFGPSGLGGGTGNFVQEQREGRERRSSDDDDDLY